MTVPRRYRHSLNDQRLVLYAGRKADPFQKKRSGRCFVTHEAINNRVATKQSCVLSDSGAGSKSRAGFIRHKNKYTARPICVSFSGSTSSGGRCANNSVARHRSPVCVPPTSVDPTVTRKTTPRASTVVTDSSSMAATTMVSGPAEAVSNQCSTVAPLSGHTRSNWLDTSKARDFQSSRLDVIRGNLNTRGYSDKVSAALAQSVRTSTNSVYDAKWTNYTTWCKQKSCDPLSLDGPQISEYFVHLFEDVGLSYSTLRGYKASLFTVLASVGVLSDEVRLVIKNLFKSFANRRRPKPTEVPAWDLGLVLQAFTTKPFEPLDKCSFDFLSYKFVFLLALATGARRGELLALRRDKAFVRFKDDKTGVWLYPDPDFVPKSRRKAVCGAPPLFLSSLSTIISKSEPDYSLCPVRCLKYYLARTESPEVHKGRRRLLLPANLENLNELTPQGLSLIFKRAISAVYSTIDSPTVQGFKVNIHQARLLSHSLAAASNVSLDSILSSGHWASHNTFTSHYLKSLAVYSDELYKLGPLPAAQQTVCPVAFPPQ